MREPNTPVAYEKGFNATLFDCLRVALSSYLGEAAAYTLFYAIQERFGLTEAQFPQQPLVVLAHLKTILGAEGFRAVERPFGSQIRQIFGIESYREADFSQLLELARQHYFGHAL